MKTLRLLLATLVLAIALPSCAAVLPAISTISAVVTNAIMVLEIVDQAAETFFETHPDTPADVKARYRAAYVKCAAALDAGVKAVRGARSLSQEEYDAAFKDFKEAWIELRDVLGKHGIAHQGALSLSNGERFELPEPEALMHRVQ